MTRPAAMIAGLIVASAVVSLGAQGKAKPYAAKTPWGDPDLQGVWDYKTITPLERPANFGERQFLNDEEVARLEANAAKRLDSPPDENTPANLVHAPYMTDPGRKVDEDHRTSLIVDPPNGRMPPLTAEAQQRADDAPLGRPRRRSRRPRKPQLPRTLHHVGLPTAILPGLYNNNIRILQGPGYVAITHEMIHDTRIVPLDGRPGLSLEDPSVVRRLARPLGRRHARRRHRELQRQDELPRLGRHPAPGRALHAHRPRTTSSIASPSTIRRRGRSRGRSKCPCARAKATLRVRVPRRQLRAAQHPRSRARRGKGGRGCDQAVARRRGRMIRRGWMGRRETAAAPFVAGYRSLLVAARPALAHHSFAAEFDANAPVRSQGHHHEDGMDQPALVDPRRGEKP